MTTEQVLDQHIGIIRKMSWTVAKKHNIEFTEVMGEAYLIFMECLKKQNDNLAKFNTFLFCSLKALERRVFKNVAGYSLHWSTKDVVKVQLTEAMHGAYTMSNLDVSLLDTHKVLSNDAVELLDNILVGKSQELTYNNKQVRLGTLKRYQAENAQWGERRTAKAFNELQRWYVN